VALLVGTAASAAEPSYFHKPNVERERFVTDYLQCEELAGGVRRSTHQVYSANLYAVLAVSIFAGFMSSREQRANMQHVMRTCMADKGYRRVEASKSIRKELKGLSSEARVERLFALAASPEPEGKVLPL